jgi:septal ring factor EnvC (AmiA/AmiB activator)
MMSLVEEYDKHYLAGIKEGEKVRKQLTKNVAELKLYLHNAKQELTELKSTYDDLVQRYTTLESNHIGLHKQHDTLKELCNAILKVAEENCDHSDEIMNLKEFMESD